MIYESPPRHFKPVFYVSGCFVDVEGRILLLHRREHKPEGGMWGVPAGKLDQNETPEMAMLRELREETNISLIRAQIRLVGHSFVRFPTYDFVYYSFQADLPGPQPEVHIREAEHQAYRWVTMEETAHLPLMPDLDECIRRYYRPSSR